MFDPTARRPWIGLYEHKKLRTGKYAGKYLWKIFVSGVRPGHVNFWGALTSKRRSLPARRILVVTGPGPFTGTRAAVNIANGLGYTWNVPVYGVSARVNLEKPQKIIYASQKILKKLREISTQKPRGFSMPNRALPYYVKPAHIG